MCAPECSSCGLVASEKESGSRSENEEIRGSGVEGSVQARRAELAREIWNRGRHRISGNVLHMHAAILSAECKQPGGECSPGGGSTTAETWQSFTFQLLSNSSPFVATRLTCDVLLTRPCVTCSPACLTMCCKSGWSRHIDRPSYQDFQVI